MKYKAMWTIGTSSKKYALGDEIELTDLEAAPLLKSGAIEPIIKRFSRPVEKTALHTNNLEN